MTTARPELDPELRHLLADMPLMSELSPEILAHVRPFSSAPVEPLLADRQVDRREVTVPAKDGTPIRLSVFSPASGDHPSAAPCVYWMHGGGMVMGDRFSQIDIPLEWLDGLGAVVVSVDYRLAPEATGTTLVDDCYEGLLWTVEHAAELGVDPARIVVAGASAGGGLAAGVALLARDLGTPALAGQLLIGPMLDHRNTSVSSRQYSGVPGVWTGEMNAFGWRCVLGDLTGADVSPYVSPALADDLSGLPTTYIDTGSAEVFRDEDAAYAAGIWAAGGQAELHVWAGGFHGFDALYPQAGLSATARRTRTDWLTRVLAPDRAPDGAPVTDQAMDQGTAEDTDQATRACPTAARITARITAKGARGPFFPLGWSCDWLALSAREGFVRGNPVRIRDCPAAVSGNDRRHTHWTRPGLGSDGH